jgi:acetyltransferase EpsM
MKEIIIIGAGGHAAELRDYINHLNTVSDEQIVVKGFLDDNEDNYRYYDYQEPYLGTIQEHKVQVTAPYLMGIANIKYRRSIVERFLEERGHFIGLIHPTALISPSAQIGEGVVISHNASVGPKVELGNYNILNSRCTIGHDSVIGDFNFISPQVAVSGNTRIGDENMIGTNSCTIPGVSIGNKNIIAAGMVVYKPVGDNETVIFRHKERLIIRDNTQNE